MDLEKILNSLGQNIYLLEQMLNGSNYTVPNGINKSQRVENKYSTLLQASDNYLKFNKIITFFSLIAIFIGLIGNSISFQVLVNPLLRISTNIYLCGLCISSFISLFGMSTVLLVQSFGHTSMYSRIIFRMYPVTYPLTLTFQLASILLIVAVSINRFIYVYYSKGNQTSSIARKREREYDNKRALIIITLIYLFSIIYCVPYWFIFKFDSSTFTVEFTTLGISPSFKFIIHFGMYLPLVYIIPFTTLLITNSYLVIF